MESYIEKNKEQSQSALIVQKKKTENNSFFLKDNRKNTTPIQRVITMKGEGGAKRSDGKLKSLKSEVTKTISTNKPSDMLETIDQLEQSIDSREREQARNTKGTAKYNSEQYRIDQEEILLGKLRRAREIDLATRKQAKAAAEAKRQAGAPKGFKVVGKKGKAK
ncbi:MAG: hypothetical protein AB8B65_07125 [Kordia sp.]|uniref:hypothetical protein n=1 Tax=Kordia sp. TaxID=1965332 RepID=UPI00385CB1B1